MTTDLHFNRWMKRAGILFLLILIYILVTDMTTPMSSYSMLYRPVVAIAPRVSGEVTEVIVENNQLVHAGDVLFRIDPRDYELALEKSELALREVNQTNATLKAQLAQAEANVAEAQVNEKEAIRELNRIRSLVERNMVSQQEIDQAQTQAQAAKARLNAAIENRNAAEVNLGDAGEQNLRVRMAVNEVKQAQLNLSRTEIIAPEDGVISNLQLMPGVQASANQPLMSLVTIGHERITADFREKSLSHVDHDVKAWVVFDAIPGEVFAAQLTGRDLGVAQGQLQADGLLAHPDDSDRWVRDAQRVRVYLDMEETKVPDTLVTGSRATVMLAASDSSIMKMIGSLQMHIISLLRYIY
ncbi:MAG: hemolysin D [Oceanospirillaceae bacterium]|uniref:HlyD family secretion protein n=1 Tax=unclassified Thalassolituus TaxID=2624967 RepID=UPI000C09AF33|nr:MULTISPECIES: HlyD family secretion protein [unclassified Thalassolituus]MAK92643.1 hemolysin D [Thalassolituus sp.]MAS26018.1 hemolysin D [Oceanospirillaceae bacterium]MAY00175.1 hemolysin D [Oceanospirillaceae bacterium]MBL33943.1 hemolysin D [Oceanospirillaceae bacterium]MBS52923.1 hemolysin D [Oceanospirillaceae bacterium]|tara:strand:- start:4165 stop:5232 length:1068 start_codon:yes stop_codon:yes gene_type:complete